MILMPLLLGMGSGGIASQFGAAFSAPMLMSLVGHLIYGLLTGLVYVAYATSRPARRASESTA
jgi:ABC-type antimicrobial peptide transport system permease subunit